MRTPVSTGGPATTVAAQPAPPTQHLTQPPTQPAAPLELPVSALRSARTTLALELGKLRRKRYWLIAASATAVCLAKKDHIVDDFVYASVSPAYLSAMMDTL